MQNTEHSSSPHTPGEKRKINGSQPQGLILLLGFGQGQYFHNFWFNKNITVIVQIALFSNGIFRKSRNSGIFNASDAPIRPKK